MRPYREEPLESFGSMLQAVAQNAISGGHVLHHGLEPSAIAGAGEKFPTDGGFAVAPEFENEVLETITESFLISRVRTFPMSTNRLVLPRINETSRADGERAGGILSAWAEEGDAVAATRAKYGSFTLQPRKNNTFIRTSDELLADGPALNAHILHVLSKEVRFVIEYMIVNGVGTTMPLGVLKSDALITVTPESGHAPNTITAADIKSMMARCWPASMGNAVWLMGLDAYGQIVDGSFSNAQPIVQFVGGRKFILGAEVFVCEYAAPLGTVGDIVLMDPSQYILGNRGANLSLSLHVYFLSDEGIFRFSWRIDGQPSFPVPIIPLGGTVPASPFVTLGAR